MNGMDRFPKAAAEEHRRPPATMAGHLRPFASGGSLSQSIPKVYPVESANASLDGNIYLRHAR